jgi:hypothetical protein
MHAWHSLQGHTLQLFRELEVQINLRSSFILISTRFTDIAVLTQYQFSVTHLSTSTNITAVGSEWVRNVSVRCREKRCKNLI